MKFSGSFSVRQNLQTRLERSGAGRLSIVSDFCFIHQTQAKRRKSKARTALNLFHPKKVKFCQFTAPRLGTRNRCLSPVNIICLFYSPQDNWIYLPMRLGSLTVVRRRASVIQPPCIFPFQCIITGTAKNDAVARELSGNRTRWEYGRSPRDGFTERGKHGDKTAAAPHKDPRLAG